jgi:hypothetical protein
MPISQWVVFYCIFSSYCELKNNFPIPKKDYNYQLYGGNLMGNNNFGVLFFFAILGFIATTVFSFVIISQNNTIKSQLENK